jgi:hypothetical protein
MQLSGGACLTSFQSRSTGLESEPRESGFLVQRGAPVEAFALPGLTASPEMCYIDGM